MIHARVALQQRILPEYRAAFFETLATACLQGLSVFAGEPRHDEAAATVERLSIANYSRARNLHFLSGGAYFYWQAGLLRWLRSWQPDVLVVELNPRNRSNPLATGWMRSRGKPVVGWGLGIAEHNSLASALQRSALGACSAIIAYSEVGARQYIEAGVEPSRVFIAANAVAPRPSDPPVQRSLTYHDGKPELLFVGRLQPRKRVDALLHALALLPVEKQPRLVIIGDGPDRSRLEALAREFYPRAEFVGTKHGDALAPYYADADLFILPGTGGLAVQQAMAHALPVIVGEADGTQGELVREENGWLLPDDNPQTIARIIDDALTDIARLRQKGLASYRIVAEEVNLEAMVQVFTNAIESVMREVPERNP